MGFGEDWSRGLCVGWCQTTNSKQPKHLERFQFGLSNIRVLENAEQRLRLPDGARNSLRQPASQWPVRVPSG
eukprot:9986214-Alexandrium_andersonii.AAC.1